MCVSLLTLFVIPNAKKIKLLLLRFSNLSNGPKKFNGNANAGRRGRVCNGGLCKNIVHTYIGGGAEDLSNAP